MRPSGRKTDQIRPVSIETNITKHAEGSCLIKCGDTHVICTASVEESVPHFLRKSGLGWVTAEYGMIPRSTGSRMRRESSSNRQSGRTLEIQRLIGRSLRSVVDRVILVERQIVIDCDVIQADGGTRCAAITGGWVALRCATKKLMDEGMIKSDPLSDNVAAISCGIFAGTPIIDLDYSEDSEADVDANFVMTGSKKIVEIQASAEKQAFSRTELTQLINLAENGVQNLITAQMSAIS
jgi:ribonuclease PH